MPKKTWKFCPECGFPLQSEFKFCPGCGEQLRQSGSAGAPSRRVIVAQELPRAPKSGISIEFGNSTSPNFAQALKLASRESEYVTAGQGRAAVHRATFRKTDLERAVPLAKLVGRWKSAKTFVDGQEEPWDTVFGFAYCFSQREASYEATLYCFGQEQNRLCLWGCFQSNMRCLLARPGRHDRLHLQ